MWFKSTVPGMENSFSYKPKKVHKLNTKSHILDVECNRTKMFITTVLRNNNLNFEELIS